MKRHQKVVKIPKNYEVIAENLIFWGNGGHLGFWAGTLFCRTRDKKYCHFMLRC